MKNIYIILVMLSAFGAIVSSCSDPEESLEWRSGENLRISGADTISTLSSVSYYVQGFTIDETYNWTLDGPSGEFTVRREGEFVDAFMDEPGTYTLSVSNGNYDGSLTIVAESVVQELGFESDSITVMEISSDTLMIPVNISERNLAGTSVAFSVDGTSTASTDDYEILTDSPLVFGEDETEQFIMVVILSDQLREEAAETLIINLDEITQTGEGEYEVIFTDSTELTTYTIYIEDDLKYVSFEDAENDSTVSNAGNYVYNVMLSSAADSQVTIPYSVTGTGVTPLVGELTFAEGTTVQPLPIAINDLAFETDQSIVISLGEPISDDEEVMIERDEEDNPVGTEKTIVIDVE